MSRLMNPKSRASRLLIQSVIAATAVATSGAAVEASSLLEIYGTIGVGGGTVTGETYGISWRADKLEWTLGTYAHSGGTLSSGGTIAGGGVDAALTLRNFDESLIATNDNLSATNKDAEIRTTTVTGRPGSATWVPSSWTGGGRWSMTTPDGASLGNGKFALVSYVPNDSFQYLDNLTLSANAALTGIYGTNTRYASPNTGTQSITDRLKLTAGSDVRIRNGNINAKNVTIENSSITVDGAGFLESDYIDFGGGADDRSTMTITGTGGIKAQSLQLAMDTNAAVTVDQRNGLVDAGSLYVKWVNIPPTTFVSHYNLYGGTLKVGGLAMKDAILHVAGGRLELAGLPSLTVNKRDEANNATLAWESGTIAVTQQYDTVMSTGGFLGSSIAITAGKTLELNAPGVTSFVTLAGGKLALRELADNGLNMDWQSGELALTGTAATTLAAGKPLGNQLTLRSGMTLRTGGFLNVDVGSRLLLNDGGRATVTGMNNKGEIRFSGNGDGWLENIGTNAITNTGLITGSGRIGGWIGNAAAGRVEVAAADDLRIVGGLVNDGQVRLTGGALTVTTSITNNAGGTITGRGTLTVGTLDNAGTLTFAGGMSDVDATLLRNRAGAKTIVTGAGQAIFYRNVTNDVGSEFRVSADSRATFLGTVTNAGAFTGGGVKVFEGNVSGGLLASGVGSSVVEPGATLDVAGIRESSLTIRGSAALTSGSVTSRLTGITFDGGTLDLRNNSLVVDYAAGAASPRTQVQLALADGALKSSSLTSRQAIAIVDGAAYGGSSLGGVAVDASSLILAVALRGDANLNGAVQFEDLVVLAQNYNGAGPKTWSTGDFTADSKTNFDDLVVLAQNYNSSMSATLPLLEGVGGASFATDFALAMSLVPEPTSIAALAALATLTLGRRPR